MERARVWAESERGLGVWFPSPSEYEPTAFLAALSDVTAARFEDHYDEKTGRTTTAARRRYVVLLIATQLLGYLSAVLLVAGFGNRVFGSEITKYLNGYTLAGALLLCGTAWLFFHALSRNREDRLGLGRVRRAAEELRRQVRYVVTTKESSEFGGEAKQIGLGAQLRRVSERQLVERPATLSSLVHNFRAFSALMARELEGPLVIAIDELDKMSDAQKVANLLRDIKGVFDIPGVYFLVSLSDEAARSLQLGGIRSRNEFNSSFYTVLVIPPLNPAQSLALLRHRQDAFDADVGRALGVIAGGIPREIVRLADSAYGGVPSTRSATSVLIEAADDECRSFLSEILTAEHPGLAADEKVAVWRCLSDQRAVDARTLFAFATGMLRRWDMNDASLAWRDHYQEPWRRLIIRIVIAALIVSRPEQLGAASQLARLQNIVIRAASSAAVARAELGHYLIDALYGQRKQRFALGAHEIDLALFLLDRGRVAFTKDDYDAVRSNGNIDGSRALDVLCADGILESRRTGFKRQWRLSERACRCLPRPDYVSTESVPRSIS